MRLVYFGKIADGNTNLLRNAGLAGVLSRSTSQRANLVNAMQIAEQRGWNVAERHEQALRPHRFDPRWNWRPTRGVTTVEGAVVLDKPRLIQVDGIYCEAALAGHLIFMKNQDVPGVIGHVGTVLGKQPASTSPTSRWAAATALPRPASRWKRSRWSPPTTWCRRACWRSCARTPPSGSPAAWSSGRRTRRVSWYAAWGRFPGGRTERVDSLIDNARVYIGSTSVTQLVRWAYSVSRNQVVGGGQRWAEAQRSGSSEEIVNGFGLWQLAK